MTPEELKKKQESALQELGDDAAKNGIALLRTPHGFTFAPIKDGEPMSPDDFSKLPKREQTRVTNKVAELTERLKDIIKYKAHIIFPGEVETILSQYTPVREVAVVGVTPKETEFGQIVKAFIVLKDEYKNRITKDDIIDFCRDKLAIYKLPKEIEFIDELPRNAMGKVVRKELRNVMVISI